MSDEEQLNKALEHLRNLSATKEHKWTVQLIAEDDEQAIRCHQRQYGKYY